MAGGILRSNEVLGILAAKQISCAMQGDPNPAEVLMAEYFMGQIMMTGFGFAPKGFAQCSGGTLPISQNAALYSLLGITYGGDGTATFRLPDLRGRTPLGGGFPSQDARWQPPLTTLGSIGGTEQVTLTADQNAAHTHFVVATSDAGVGTRVDGPYVFAQTPSGQPLYGEPASLLPLSGGPSSTAGAGAPHDNMQPFQTINFNIALTGIYPSRG